MTRLLSLAVAVAVALGVALALSLLVGCSSPLPPASESLPQPAGSFEILTRDGTLRVVRHRATGACFVVYVGYNAGGITDAPREVCDTTARAAPAP